MQYGLMGRLGLFGAGLVIATTVRAVQTPPVWGEQDDYVRLEAVGANNQHPVTLSSEQFAVLLGQFYKRERSKQPARYFSSEEITRLSPQLARLFAQAKPDQDIEFTTSFRPGDFPVVPRALNAGRLFIENGQLNLLIGTCARAQDTGYRETFGSFPKLDDGSRAKPAGKIGCELLAGNGTEPVDNRKDWLRLDINAALAARNAPVFPAPPTLTNTTTASPEQAKTPQPVSPPAATAVPAEPPAPANPASPAGDIEGRLTLLKRLHDKGLITDAEYEQKRAAILKDL